MPTSALLDRGQIRHNLDEFVSRWRGKLDSWDAVERGHSERSHAQTLWSDLLRQFGVIPERISLFEHEADRATTGNRGYIDVFWSNVFIGEAKSVGKDLAVAEKQALDYLAGGSIGQHEWPKYVIATDFATFRVRKLGDDGWTDTFGLDDLAGHVDQLMFLAGQETVTRQEEAEASILASAVMAGLYTAMVGDDADAPVGDLAPTDADAEDEQVQRASVFLTRVLFLLYGDDAGLWEEDLFHRFVLYDTTPDNLGAQLSALFDVLNTRSRRHVPQALARFPYVNGALYADPMPVQFFTPAMRDALLEACRFRWTRISPAVFGSMFQMVKSREARRSGGEHYTTEANILKTIGPLFVDELQAEADRLCRNASTTVRELGAFQDTLASHMFLDPACGSGNFLAVAYSRLRDIETQIIVEIRRRRGTGTDMALDVTMETKVTIDQMHGFEIAWWPAKIAETAMFLVDHQANRKLAAAVGQAPDRLPITITAHIHHVNALTTPWEDVCAVQPGQRVWVFGNPPFAGHKERSAAQARELQQAWGRPVAHLDYVTAWFAKAAAYARYVKAAAETSTDWAFVSTNSVAMGESVPAVFAPLFSDGWKLKFAHRTFPWSSDAPGQAAVHVVIIGFTKADDGQRRLFDYPVRRDDAAEERRVPLINAYLCDGPNVLVMPRTTPLSPQMGELRAGSTPIDFGHLTKFTDDELAQARNDPIASKYLRPYMGGEELINGTKRWCLWMPEGVLDPEDLGRSRFLAERVARVREARASRDRAATRALAAYPYQFGEIRQPRWDTYLALPQTFSENRDWMTLARLDQTVVPTIKLFTTEDPDGFLFAVASSAMFLTWQLTVGGRMKSDPSLSSSVVWNTFPLPDVNQTQRRNIIAAGQRIIDARNEHPQRTLATHYQPLAMAQALVKAHQGLDSHIDKVMGANRRCGSTLERQRLLFDRYAEATADLIAPEAPRRRPAARRTR